MLFLLFLAGTGAAAEHELCSYEKTMQIPSNCTIMNTKIRITGGGYNGRNILAAGYWSGSCKACKRKGDTLHGEKIHIIALTM